MSEDASATLEPSALVEEHLPLVEHIVLRLSATFPRFIDRSDLVSAGTLGLVEAAHRFDPKMGVPFGRFAARRIRGAILDLLRSTDWAPRSVRAMTREVERAEQSLTVRNGRRPDDAELAAEIGVSPSDLAELRGRVQRGVVMTIDNAGDDLTGSPAQRIYDRCAPTPEEDVEFAEVRGYVRDALDNLPDRHRIVAIGYYLEGRSFEELAELLSITPSRVSQLRAEAVIMMRDGISTQYDERAQERNERPVGRVARRQARYASAIARNSSWRERLLAVDKPMVAELSSGLAEATGA